MIDSMTDSDSESEWVTLTDCECDCHCESWVNLVIYKLLLQLQVYQLLTLCLIR